jgi:L-alanine-DL-glutamate epimerase-like enolase superfamily enzyme
VQSAEPNELGSGAVKIARIDLFVLKVTLAHPRTFSKGSVQAGGASRRGSYPIVMRITSTDGAEGFSQVRPPTPWLGETTDSICAAVRYYYGPALIGANAAERSLLPRRLERLLPNNSVALSSLDTALNDLVGKSYGLPVYALWGGGQQKIPLNWSVTMNPRDVMVAEAARAVKEFGVGMVCIKSGGPGRWRDDIETIKEVRAAIGPEAGIAMDPNEGFDVPTALRVLRGLESEHVSYLEQPLPRNDVSGLSMLRSMGGVPVMLDEGAITLADANRMINAGACDGLVLKLWKSGSFLRAVEMAGLAEAAGLRTTVGGVSQGSILGAAASAHLYACVERAPIAGEFVLGLNVLEQDPIAILPDDFKVIDGFASVPQSPGLGVTVDMKAVQELSEEVFTVE